MSNRYPIDGEAQLEEVLEGAWARIEDDTRLDDFLKGWQLARILSVFTDKPSRSPR